MKKLFSLTLALLLALSLCAPSAGAMFDETLTLTGTAYASYEYNHQGVGSTAIILKLDTPIHTHVDAYDTDIVYEVHLALKTGSGLTKADLEACAGQRVTVTGETFEAHTGHHFRPLVMLVSQISVDSVVGGFRDVRQSDWFAQPVAWAVERKITNGTSATAFSPHDTCTTAQILTFLWRSQGSPMVSGANPFPGMDMEAWYATAAVWASRRGLISDFSPNAPCRRGDVVTYLWKLADEPPAPDNSFSDVSRTDPCRDAVNWAVDAEITTGVSATRFAPEKTCTRAQIVTFLYRYEQY